MQTPCPGGGRSDALGFGASHELPLPSHKYGTIPDEAWKMRRYKQEWTQSDTLNAAINAFELAPEAGP